MNYKVTFKKSGYDDEITTISVEAGSAEEAADGVRLYYRARSKDIISVESEEE